MSRMRSGTGALMALLAGAAVLASLPVALAHGDKHEAEMDTAIKLGQQEARPDAASYPQTYFTYTEHAGLLHAHIILMVVAWMMVLPIGVMLSIVRSRYTLPVQLFFLGSNLLGLGIGASYNAKTPDLYPNNAHHKISWIATWIVCAQVFVGLVGRVAGHMKSRTSVVCVKDERAYIPVSAENMAELQRISAADCPPRPSKDSGHPTEPNTESLRSDSLSSSAESSTDFRRKRLDDDIDQDLELEPFELEAPSKVNACLGRLASKISGGAWRFLLLAYDTADRTTLMLGYLALVTGIATWGRFFEGHEIYTGLAHWIKGSVFFWYGLLTLARWTGSFGDLGWAWNLRPKQSSGRWRPSAEFVEGALIFTYGSTNIFLEHLGSQDQTYSAQDLEHISITVLFIGGGLLAMLVESTRMRELLNSSVTEVALSHPPDSYTEEERVALQPPRQYQLSTNPVPALVIFLLGIMMGSHNQQSMLSTMVHKQWGNLLTGASFSRCLTYVLLYLKPPRSVLPSRPPTELLTAFSLIAGGLIFMASSGDTIDGMAHYDLDAMFFYTVTLGFVGLLMAWTVIVLALKGWAMRIEADPPQTSWESRV